MDGGLWRRQLIASPTLTVVRMWNVGDTRALIVRDMQTAADISGLSETNSVYKFWANNGHKIKKNSHKIPHWVSPDTEGKRKPGSWTGSWRPGFWLALLITRCH